MDATADALKRQIDKLRSLKRDDGTSERQEGGITENIMDPDTDDSDHPMDLSVINKVPGEEAVNNDPVSQKLQMSLEKAKDDGRGSSGHEQSDEAARHLEILKQMVGKKGGHASPKAGMGLRERGTEMMKAKLAALNKKSGIGDSDDEKQQA